MTRVTSQFGGTLFEMGDFPPVALLVSSLRENCINGDKFIVDMIDFLGGDKGTNRHPLFVESFASWVENGGDFAPLVSPTNVLPESIEYFVDSKQISAAFLQHCIRFRIMPVNIIDWVVILKNGFETTILDKHVVEARNFPNYSNLHMEDAYYLTAVANKINVPAYRVFSRIPNKKDFRNRLRYESIKKYHILQKRLHGEGQQYTSKEVFMIAELYTIEDIMKLVNANYTLEEVLRFNKFGLVDVNEIIENGNNIPEEWLKVID